MDTIKLALVVSTSKDELQVVDLKRIYPLKGMNNTFIIETEAFNDKCLQNGGGEPFHNIHIKIK